MEYIIITITKDELIELIDSTVRTALHQQYEIDHPYYTRKEVAKLFGVSDTTLWRMVKLYPQIFKKVRVGHKILFSKTEIDAMFEKGQDIKLSGTTRNQKTA